MKYMSASDIGKKGEKIVYDWFKNHGYSNVKWDTKGKGSSDIEAKSDANHYLVQVKTAVEPNKPSGLSSDETRNLKSRATKIGAQPKLAQVQLDKNLTLKGDIKWIEP